MMTMTTTRLASIGERCRCSVTGHKNLNFFSATAIFPDLGTNWSALLKAIFMFIDVTILCLPASFQIFPVSLHQ